MRMHLKIVILPAAKDGEIVRMDLDYCFFLSNIQMFCTFFKKITIMYFFFPSSNGNPHKVN